MYYYRKITIAFFVLFSLSLTSKVFGQGFMSKVVVESGMHTKPLNCIASDPEGEFLVTAGEDNMVKVWDVLTGSNLKTFYLPTNDIEWTNSIFSIAVTPNRRKILLGGNVKYNNDKLYSIYVFDIRTGEYSRLQDFKAPITKIKISPDGTYMAVGMAGSEGVRIYTINNLELVGEDKKYSGPLSALDFSEDNFLVTVSTDNQIRVYDNQSKQPAKQPKEVMVFPVVSSYTRGVNPSSVAFYKGSKNIIVGYEGVKTIDVYLFEQGSLSFSYEADTKQIDAGGFGSIVLSKDKVSVIAGGDLYSDKYGTLVRKWDNLEKNRMKNIAIGASGKLKDIVALSDGEFAYVTEDPSMGVIDKDGRIVSINKSNTLNFNSTSQDKFFISPDGSSFALGLDTNAYLYYNSTTDDFMVENRLNLPEETFHYSRAITNSKDFSSWKNSLTPMFKGKILTLDISDAAKSLSIKQENDMFALGTNKKIRLYNFSEGTLISEVSTDGVPAWCVNISSDSKTLVAVLGDGTIRWYSLPSLTPLLSFFAHKDLVRWVAWTPTGYYNASIGGSNFTGWKISSSPTEKVNFIPSHKFSKTYYKPYVIRNVVSMGSEENAYRKSSQESEATFSKLDPSQMTIPEIFITNVENGSLFDKEEVVFNCRVQTPNSHGVTSIKVCIDGKYQVNQEENLITLAKNKSEVKKKVKLPKRDCIVSLIARNKFGESTPATLELFWDDKKETQKSESDLYVFTIVADKNSDTTFPIKEDFKYVDDFVSKLKMLKGKTFREVYVREVKGEQATLAQMSNQLTTHSEGVKQNDVAITLLAGSVLMNNLGELGIVTSEHSKDIESLFIREVILEKLRIVAGQSYLITDLYPIKNKAASTKVKKMIEPNIVEFVNPFSTDYGQNILITGQKGNIPALPDGKRPIIDAFVDFMSNYLPSVAQDKQVLVKDLFSYMSKSTKKNQGYPGIGIVAAPETFYSLPIKYSKK